MTERRGSWKAGLCVLSVLRLCLPLRGVNRMWLPYCAPYYPCCSMLCLIHWHCCPGYFITTVTCCKNAHWLITYLCQNTPHYAAESLLCFNEWVFFCFKLFTCETAVCAVYIKKLGEIHLRLILQKPISFLNSHSCACLEHFDSPLAAVQWSTSKWLWQRLTVSIRTCVPPRFCTG